MSTLSSHPSAQCGMERWQGKTAVVTGASSGIGDGIVRRLVAEGLVVVALARRTDRLKALEDELNSAHPGKCTVRTCDVSEEEKVKETFDWISENFGPISVLVNNAGVLKFLPLYENHASDAKEIYDINVMGTIYCAQHGLAAMKAAGVNDGHIINISRLKGRKRNISGENVMSKIWQVLNAGEVFSLSAHKEVLLSGLCYYATSKKVVTSLGVGLKKELAENNSKIRVTNISPGLVITDMTKFYMEQFPDAVGLTPSDVADSVVFAISAPVHVNISEITIEPVN